MHALMAIALICQVNGGMFSTINSVAEEQLKCQKELIACYESKFPNPPPSEAEWVGGLKDCLKSRELK